MELGNERARAGDDPEQSEDEDEPPCTGPEPEATSGPEPDGQRDDRHPENELHNGDVGLCRGHDGNTDARQKGLLWLVVFFWKDSPQEKC